MYHPAEVIEKDPNGCVGLILCRPSTSDRTWVKAKIGLLAETTICGRF